MATTMHCDIVSAEKEIFSGPVTMVIATGTLGELGILPGHAPLLTGIKPGPVRLQFENDDVDVFFASGGFLEVQPSVVTILAGTALHAERHRRGRRAGGSATGGKGDYRAGGGLQLLVGYGAVS